MTNNFDFTTVNKPDVYAYINSAGKCATKPMPATQKGRLFTWQNSDLHNSYKKLESLGQNLSQLNSDIKDLNLEQLNNLNNYIHHVLSKANKSKTPSILSKIFIAVNNLFAKCFPIKKIEVYTYEKDNIYIRKVNGQVLAHIHHIIKEQSEAKTDKKRLKGRPLLPSECPKANTVKLSWQKEDSLSYKNRKHGRPLLPSECTKVNLAKVQMQKEGRVAKKPRTKTPKPTHQEAAPTSVTAPKRTRPINKAKPQPPTFQILEIYADRCTLELYRNFRAIEIDVPGGIPLDWETNDHIEFSRSHAPKTQYDLIVNRSRKSECEIFPVTSNYLGYTPNVTPAPKAKKGNSTSFGTYTLQDISTKDSKILFNGQLWKTLDVPHNWKKGDSIEVVRDDYNNAINGRYKVINKTKNTSCRIEGNICAPYVEGGITALSKTVRQGVIENIWIDHSHGFKAEIHCFGQWFAIPEDIRQAYLKKEKKSRPQAIQQPKIYAPGTAPKPHDALSANWKGGDRVSLVKHPDETYTLVHFGSHQKDEFKVEPKNV